MLTAIKGDSFAREFPRTVKNQQNHCPLSAVDQAYVDGVCITP
jgi:hypothetical protein